jgi:YVTN family beta-propeller protein
MLMIFDTATDAVVGTVEAGTRLWRLAISADSKTAYTFNGPSNEVVVIDLVSRRVTTTIPVGQGPWGAAFASR